MKNLHEEAERYEKSTDRVEKDAAPNPGSHKECSPVDIADTHQLTSQPGSYSREASVAKDPIRTHHTERAVSTQRRPKEIDRCQKAKEEDQRRLAHFEKMNRQPKLPPKLPLESFLMSKEVFHKIRQTIGSFPVETGGLLMGSVEDFQVTDFIFDNVSCKVRRLAAVWYPHTESLNEQVETCERKGLVLLGVVHSHPRGFIHPSGPDGSAAWSNMTSPSNPHLNAYLLPIVQSAADGPFECRSYVATCHPEGHGRVVVHRIKLCLVD